MNELEIKEAYHILSALCDTPLQNTVMAYKEMRNLLERIYRCIASTEHLQMTDLSARISWMSVRLDLSAHEQNRLHSFRLTCNALLNGGDMVDSKILHRDIKTLAFFIKRITGVEIPDKLYHALPKADSTFITSPRSRKKIERMRVCYLYKDEEYLYVRPFDEIIAEPLRVCYHVEHVNDEFSETIDELWPHAQLNLLDVSIYDQDDILTPSFIVLEPDYLIDISSLAECFKEYGAHPANYVLSRLQPIDNTLPLLLGNIANLFLDEWIYAKTNPDYSACMKKAFARYPIELAACAELHQVEKEREFFKSCQMHFDHIRKVVTEVFNEPGYDIDKSDAVLEPSYICEPLGLQGRLDYMQRDMKSFIEMKSGKADEYVLRGKILPKENHKVQMLLYQAILQYSMGMNHQKVQAFLLYTKYPLLYPSRSSWAMVRRVINLRNRIVAQEYGMQLRNNTHYTEQCLDDVTPDELNVKDLHGVLWDKYLRPNIARFSDSLRSLSKLERNYFFALYNFISKELYTSKTGDIEYEGKRGAASLWLSSLTDKLDSGEILYDLEVIENHADDEHKAHIIFKIAQQLDEQLMLPNFRLGDAVVLYERENYKDNVTNKMVFKGNIEAIDSATIKIRLRATQHNIAVLPNDKLYAVEHDFMDTSFRSMFLSLSVFMNANQDRRDLLLAQRVPLYDENVLKTIHTANNDFERIAIKAEAAKDCFLLVGPPGTGKTSMALKLMVERFYKNEHANILLLSYTNRAVDEICKSLSRIEPEIDYIRVGSELSCDPQYRGHLLENRLAQCNRRSDVKQCIDRCRIIVGTVATLSGRPELFKLKHFSVAIIDESSQILEPQLLGILCAKNPQGQNAIDKFIMIGDHKQLPAVVLQSEQQSEICDEALLNIGLSNLRNSLFERLYNHLRIQHPLQFDAVCDILCKQGRMHPIVAEFPNLAFYGGLLQPVGLDHQKEEDDGKRIGFYKSSPEPLGGNMKINHSEAKIVANLAKQVFEREMALGTFDVTGSLGIITPYRSQIVLIKHEIEQLGIPQLNSIIIDTVERFQGSERDTIIYSFCINTSYQTRLLSNIAIEDGIQIDRKLNVALTRARKQMLITGVVDMLILNPIYKHLIKWLNDNNFVY